MNLRWCVNLMSGKHSSINNNIQDVITALLEKLPRLCNVADLRLKTQIESLTIEEALKNAGPWGIKTKALIDARNRFFDTLENFINNKNTIQAEQEVAEDAEKAGYSNAYYDLAKAFEQKGFGDEALTVYALVSEKSCHYENVMSMLQQKYYIYAI